MKCILICGLLLSSHYYLQFNQNVALLSPCCCIMCAELRARQGSTPTMQYTPPCQYLIWMLAGRPSFSQPTTESAIRATQQPSGISCPSEYILRSLICFCANVGIAILFVFPWNTRTLSVILNMGYVRYSQRSHTYFTWRCWQTSCVSSM